MLPQKGVHMQALEAWSQGPEKSNLRCLSFAKIRFLIYLIQIDDKEFDLPEVTSPPTLESILNEVITLVKRIGIENGL